ncbi:hypothetical protein [Neptunitalea chrysea]|uniref:hypothetical protein n=1 Tax=Neptunitalea chrysea TaxID=1647581 RepID=UPI0024938C27|nr:hypothetical protein [Neptunitalea chrysea]
MRKGVMVLKCVISSFSVANGMVISCATVCEGSIHPEQLPQAKKGEQLLQALCSS